MNTNIKKFFKIVLNYVLSFISYIYLYFKKNYYLLSSLLIFLSFPSYDFFILKGFTFFAWISMIPMFIYFYKNKQIGYKEVYKKSLVTFLIGIFLAFGWISAFGGDTFIGKFLVIVTLIPMLSFFFSARILLSEILSRFNPKMRVFIFPAVWIAFDFIQTIGYLAFPWTFWGYSQYPFDSLMQVSSYIGVMGITFLIILFNSIASNGIIKFRNGNKKLTNYKFESIFIIILLSIFLFGKIRLLNNPYTKPGKYDLKFSLIQSCINPWDDWMLNRFKFLNELRNISFKTLPEKPDFVIWSESATLDPISYHYRVNKLDDFDRMVLDSATSMNSYLFTGEIGVYRDMKKRMIFPRNSAMLVNASGNVVASYNKIQLCPFGEWFPYKKWFPWIENLLYSFGASNFYPGNSPMVLNVKGYNFGPLICYEGMFSYLSREYKKLGVDFLVNITNDGWTDYFAGHMQHFAASKFRAIENGLWYIRVGNTGYTTIIDPYGRIIKSIPILKPGFLVAGVNFSSNTKTFYTDFGDIIIYIILLITFFIYVIIKRKEINAMVLRK